MGTHAPIRRVIRIDTRRPRRAPEPLQIPSPISVPVDPWIVVKTPERIPVEVR